MCSNCPATVHESYVATVLPADFFKIHSLRITSYSLLWLRLRDTDMIHI